MHFSNPSRPYKQTEPVGVIEGGHADNRVLEYAVTASTDYLVRSVDKGVTICRADEIGFRQRRRKP